MTIHWKAVEHYFAMVLLSIYPVCNFGKFVNFGFGTVRSERVKADIHRGISSSELQWEGACVATV